MAVCAFGNRPLKQTALRSAAGIASYLAQEVNRRIDDDSRRHDDNRAHKHPYQNCFELLEIAAISRACGYHELESYEYNGDNGKRNGKSAYGA